MSLPQSRLTESATNNKLHLDRGLFMELMSQLVANRQRLTVPSGGPKPTPLVDEAKTLAAYGVADNAEVRLKDLGKQVPYRMLYLFEYVSDRETERDEYD